MKTKKIELTLEQREALRPLYEALKAEAAIGFGFGLTLGQLDREGPEFDSEGQSIGFTHAGFAVLDHEGAVKVQKVVNQEIKRMKAEEAVKAL
jgi:hypothetical protein